MSKFYRIRVGGHLDSSWSEWFEGLRLTYEANGETVLSGPIVDEAALHGVLASQAKNALRARTRLATVWVDIRPLIPGFSWI